MCTNCESKKEHKTDEKKKNSEPKEPYSPFTGLGPLTFVNKPYFAYKVLKPQWVDKTFYTCQFLQTLEPSAMRTHILYYIYEERNGEFSRKYVTRSFYDTTLEPARINQILTQVSNGNFSSALPDINAFNNKNIDVITEIVNQKKPKTKASKEDILSAREEKYPRLKGCCGSCTKNTNCCGGCSVCFFGICTWI